MSLKIAVVSPSSDKCGVISPNHPQVAWGTFSFLRGSRDKLMTLARNFTHESWFRLSLRFYVG